MRAPWQTIRSDSPETVSPVAARISRRGTLARGVFALALACALAGCDVDPDLDSANPGLQSNASMLGSSHDTELSNRLDRAPDLSIAGERLNAGLLRSFYARHSFEPVWTGQQAQADRLVEAVLHAGDQGLDPELFHASLLRRRAIFAPLDRDLLLSDAFLSYAEVLSHGAVPVKRRKDDQTLAPEPVDVPAALDAIIASPDPAVAMEALAPTTPTYLALRQALLKYRGATGKAALTRLRQIAVNLERQRWLPRTLPADRVWVNVADERLVFYRADQPVFSTRVVVGEDIERNQSPEFVATIDASFFNPPWVIPRDIAAREILPKVDQDPTYLTRNKMVLMANGEVEQLPGPEAGLGLIMFDMPNKFDVYLHDTPERNIFSRENRRISHGCIRVQNPRQLAALIMQEPIDTIDQGIATGNTTRNQLSSPVPVFVVYETAFVDTDGTLQFTPDFYSRDAEIWRQLQRRPQEREPGAQVNNRATSPALL